MATYNTGLMASSYNYSIRYTPTVQAIQAATEDVICLQELWYDHQQRSLAGATSSNYPYQYGALDISTNISTAPACNATQLSGLQTCLTTTCAAAAASGDSNKAYVCVVVNCSSVYATIKGSDCERCMIYESAITNLTYTFSVCGGAQTSTTGAKGYGLTYGLRLLSKYPISNTESRELSWSPLMLQRGFLYGEVNGTAILCTHLAPMGYAYVPTIPGITTAAEENLNQTLTILAFMNGKSANLKLMLGDFNSGPAGTSPAAYTAAFPNSYGNITAAGWTSAALSLGCTWCGSTNTMAAAVLPVVNEALDHIFYQTTTTLNASQMSAAYTINTPALADSLSDHYGVRVSLAAAQPSTSPSPVSDGTRPQGVHGLLVLLALHMVLALF